MRFFALICLITTLGVTTLGAQNKPAAKIALGFDDLTLGLSYADLTKALTDRPGFLYRGEPDVSLSPGGEEKIVQVKGGTYIERAVFQFSDDKLFSIILDLNPRTMDHFTLFTTFSKKYGDPKSLTPQQSVWDDGTVRLLLERPLTVKYLLVAVVTAKDKANQTQKSSQEVSREAFLQKL